MSKRRFSFAEGTRIALLFLVGWGVYACANMARPGGGPKDEDPPRFVRSTPAPNQLNVKRGRIEIDFDENIQVEKPSEKIIISPAQKNMPLIRSNGRRVSIELKDSLLDNTTYTIDFTDAIVDNNEKNPLKGFSFAFSTGNTIDTMEVSGYLLSASNLEPVTGMLVGLHRSLEDSAFTTKPMDRLTLSDAYGRFTVRNVAPGNYRIYALKDSERDYKFNNPTEDIAFSDSIVTPRMEMALHTDTFWLDSLTVDTVVERLLPHYYPNDIVLRAFNEDFKVQYLEKSERLSPEKITLYFSAPADTLPRIELLEQPDSLVSGDWAFVEKSLRNDTITYWLRDSSLFKQDTLRLALNYLRTDTLQQLTPFNDTIRTIYKRPKAPKKKKKKEEIPDSLQQTPTVFMPVGTVFPATLNVYESLRVTPEHPIVRLDTSGFHLEIKVDSLYKPVPFRVVNDSLLLRTLVLKSEWQPGKEYRVRVDSAAITGLYGLHNDKIENAFNVKSLDKYSNLKMVIHGIRDSAFVEVLNNGDVPIRKAPVKNGVARIMHLDPGAYYMRLVMDRNGNGKYDTGNYAEKRQPEEVYYYPNSLELRENWNITNEWDPFAVPLYQQKPIAIVKNKPKEEEKKDDSNIEYGNRTPYGRSAGNDGFGR